MTKRPNPIDVHVGARVRLRRLLLGMSQEKLGEQLGLTFQQVQKYEKGVNRIGASRLHQISEILSVPVSFFFEDLPGQETSGAAGGVEEGASAGYMIDIINTSDGLGLVKAYLEINDPVVRRRIVDLVRAIAGSHAEEALLETGS
ncbi:MAG: helix-turn-helix transcriptional regulator [Pseudomonadota bacterium]